MAPQLKQADISWEKFTVCNPNPQKSFENMCRWIFNETFLGGKALLHSNPNNPGVEVEPQFDANSGKMISFQAKFFTEVDYAQIKDSAKAAVAHYSGRLDVVYLYCNKDVTTTSKGYKEVESILRSASIDLVPITNQTILEYVMGDQRIAWYYFDYITLTHGWFQDHLRTSLNALGPRYNDAFNVVTNSEEYLNYFLGNHNAVAQINKKKNSTLSKLKRNRSKYAMCSSLLSSIITELDQIVDITPETITDSLGWGSRINASCESAFQEIHRLIKQKDQEHLNAVKVGNQDLSSRLSVERDDLAKLLEVATEITPDAFLQFLIKQQILVVSGVAGVGKSQLFAVAAERLLSENRAAILLLGSDYISNQSFFTQTPGVLLTDLSFDALLYKLEALAIQRNAPSCIFIDAVNESVDKNIWKSELPKLFSLLKKYPHVKLAISVRSGYEKLVFSDSITQQIETSQVGSIVHHGFTGETIKATFIFLNYYGIPFLPTYFLQSEMTNPLFLTLFCKTYTGENYDMYALFDKLIEKSDTEALKAIEQEDSIPLLHHLINEMANAKLSTGLYSIPQSELFKLDFWDTFGIANKKRQYVAALERSGLLIGTANRESESYSFGYNLLGDFICAKAILRKYEHSPELISYLKKDLLRIEDGKVTNYQNVDIFIVFCGLYADRFHADCFEEVIDCISDDYDRDDIGRRYVESFVWRKASSVNSKSFLASINSHSVSNEVVFRVLIENSTKVNHPLNAKFLHKLLKSKSLADRDALWTTYINYLGSEDRVFELIKYFDEGHILNGLSAQNTELLLILFTWLLTSSNRTLRDTASKASIELLKRDFALCKPLLQHFEGVNDPYVLQRLYGIIFGACVKRMDASVDSFRDLAKYVYNEIFNKDLVCPDILLRDFARLIISRWQYEYPNDCNFISTAKISPPYHSHPIPTVKPQEYYKEDSPGSGFNLIYFSMQIDHTDCPGLYGDFGRYIFQSALSRFNEIDVVNLYHYAMQFIISNLGYNEILNEYDRTLNYYRYSRHETKKIERIGKKYQWIAFHNILARISDTHLVKEYGEDPLPFEGPWEPYVRDFDPTLNVHTLSSKDVPTISYPVQSSEFLNHDPEPTHREISAWADNKPQFFHAIPSKLIVTDSQGNKWIALYLYECAKAPSSKASEDSISFTKGTQQIWLLAQANFVRENQLKVVQNYVCSEKFSRHDFPEGSDVYQLYNREYPWSPGCKSIFKEPWLDFEIETGKYRIVKEVCTVPDLDQIGYSEDGKLSIPMVEKEFERQVPEGIIQVQIMPAYSHVVWEEEYDASQKEATSFHIPCCYLIESLSLEQREADGYYYDKSGRLVCFDGSLSEQVNGLFFRADSLNEFLIAQNLELVWTCIGEKQYFLSDMHQTWSQWNGCYHYENEHATGELKITSTAE